jgi:hypothetical protein
MLVEYMILPKITTTTMGNMFYLTLMSKGEKRCGLDVTVGGLSRIVQSFRVSINAKGGRFLAWLQA